MNKYVPEFWGLDIETSGSDIKTCATIQVGLAAPNGDSIDLNVGGWRWSETELVDPDKQIALWSEEAETVHGIKKVDLLGAAPQKFVEGQLCGFVKGNSTADRPTTRIPVGWNVGGFDMPFIRRDFPRLAKLFSYRTVDLNSIIFALMQGNPDIDYNLLKSSLKNRAARLLMDEEATGGVKVWWHNAGFDARAGLKAFRLISEEIGFVPDFSTEFWGTDH